MTDRRCSCDCACARDRRIPGTLRFREPLERAEVCIRAARLLKRIAEERGQTVPANVAADAARPLPSETPASIAGSG